MTTWYSTDNANTALKWVEEYISSVKYRLVLVFLMHVCSNMLAQYSERHLVGNIVFSYWMGLTFLCGFHPFANMHFVHIMCIHANDSP